MSNFCFHFYTLEILSSIVLQVSWLFYILKINYEKLWIRQGNAPTEIKQLKPFWFIKHSSTVKKTPNISTYKNITLLRQFTPSKATDTFSITKRTENRSYNVFWSKNMKIGSKTAKIDDFISIFMLNGGFFLCLCVGPPVA